MELCTAAQAKAMDEYTINILGVPSIKLMERASEHLAQESLKIMGSGKSAAIFCGHGNNGGDGIGAALRLINAGKNVSVFLVGDPLKLSRDTGQMARRLQKLGVPLELLPDSDDDIISRLAGCSVIVDAIYGFGFHLPLSGAAQRACRLINLSNIPVVAADMPSGVETDTGFADEYAVRAHVTVTFSKAKIGQFIAPGTLFCGDVKVCDIGVSSPPQSEVPPSVETVEVSRLFPRRPRNAHKGMFGKCLIIAGSVGYTGAPSFASRAAVKSGAGLVFLGVPESIYTIEAIKNDEAMPFPLPCDGDGIISPAATDMVLERLAKCDACLIGPGLGISDGAEKVVSAVIESSTVPLVIDADGITAVSRNIDILEKAKCPVILTPHDGEFARLGGDLSAKDRLTAARDFSMEHKSVLVLKGYHTIVATPDGRAFVNTTGNPGMAKGGSGDVLSGIILSLLGQKLPVDEAVVKSVYIHGLAGDICSEKLGECSMTPSDIIDAIKDVTR